MKYIWPILQIVIALLFFTGGVVGCKQASKTDNKKEIEIIKVVFADNSIDTLKLESVVKMEYYNLYSNNIMIATDVKYFKKLNW